MKKSFVLFSTIVLIFIFSIIAVNLYELKSISSINIQNQYKYIQSKNHIEFLEEYIRSLNILENIEDIKIDNDKYEIKAIIKKIEDSKYEVELSVKAINYNVRVYKLITIDLSN